MDSTWPEIDKQHINDFIRDLLGKKYNGLENYVKKDIIDAFIDKQPFVMDYILQKFDKPLNDNVKEFSKILDLFYATLKNSNGDTIEDNGLSLYLEKLNNEFLQEQPVLRKTMISAFSKIEDGDLREICWYLCAFTGYLLSAGREYSD